MPSSSFIVFSFSLHGFQHSGICKIELICWAGKKARLTGLLETSEDCPQKIKYVSFSGFIAEVKDIRPSSHLEPGQGSVWDTRDRTSCLAEEVDQGFI